MKKLNYYINEKLKITKDTKINNYEKNKVWEDLGELLAALSVNDISLSDYISGKRQIDKNFFSKYEWCLPNVFNQKVWKYNRDINDDILNKFNSIIHGRITDFENIKYNLIEGFKKALEWI